MKISFNAQPLLDGQKTGIGFCEAETISLLIKKYSGNSYILEYFGNGDSDEEGKLHSFMVNNCTAAPCKWFSRSLYRMLWNFIPIPYRLFFNTKADVTHFFDYHVPPGVLGMRVATVHDMGYKAYPETVRFKTKVMLELSLARSCRRADKIITDSEFSKREIIKYMNINEDKIVVAPCGVNHNLFKPQADTKKIEEIKHTYNINGDYFLYLGTLEPRKNIERLIEAYAVLKQEVKDIPLLVMAGRKGWMYDGIFNRVAKLNLEQNIIFTGYIKESDTSLVVSGAIALLFPSLYEGFGMPPLEAMACGVPVLTSNCASLPEVVGDAAVLVDPYSVNDIAHGMKRLMTEENLRTELSKKGIERAKSFTWENTADIVYNVYRELLEQN